MPATASIRRGVGALAALAAAGVLGVPTAYANPPRDAYPSAQATAARAEFLTQVPAPAAGAGNVCVIDTGVTPLPDTAGQIVRRIALDGGDPGDVNHVAGDPRSGHGSFVAATIASQIDGHGSAGIWPAAKIVSVRVFSGAGERASALAYRNGIVECLHPARGFKVVTLSLSSLTATTTELAKLEDRIANTRNNFDVNVVASAGNNGSLSAVNYPARFAAAFAVGATDANGAFCAFSNRGSGLDLSTLGCNPRATLFDGSTGVFAGTSYSTPVVAGVLLALRAHRPDLTAAAAEQLLLDTAQLRRAGRVLDAAAAFRAAGLGPLVDAYRPPPPAAAPTTPPSSGDVPRGVGDVVDGDLADDRPDRPRLLAATFRRGVMRIRVSRPPRGGDALFRVGRRTYSKANGALSLRSRSWRPVTVVIEDRWGVRSEPRTVRRPRAR
ncbi:MAG: hypothetical protein AVDCRST_MAG69-1759 [uncultured Solirubrobacteraceae bacterium]|uniref:Peptidase S8/S53 domain-containing protein n=1 Tax=uncultured Solirubrobacteraceae bacterium TaxID=1162706 RepID=A0A6J4SN42_9ACTN|nr:MAG: hypothetical protein AVDCRST_MAG69-1759 [uncultured Solirubrobacteraceae bacterium]